MDTKIIFIVRIICMRKNINAFFFPPSNVLNGDILDVNAIHILIGKKGIEIKTFTNII